MTSSLEFPGLIGGESLAIPEKFSALEVCLSSGQDRGWSK